VVDFQCDFPLTGLLILLVQFADDEAQCLAVGAKDEQAFQGVHILLDLRQQSLFVFRKNAAGKQFPAAFAVVFQRFNAHPPTNRLQDEFFRLHCRADVDVHNDIGAVGIPAFVKRAGTQQQVDIGIRLV